MVLDKDGASDGSTTILVVDDEPSFRSLVTAVLGSLGYDVVVACDGEEALDLLSRKHYVGVVTDINMPNLCGNGLVRAIRRSEYEWVRNVPIIVLSSQSDPRTRLRFHQMGVNEFVAKPIDTSRLTAAAIRQFESVSNHQAETGRGIRD
ncbi:MAG: hypothetical protein Fues2KO_04520 [Fuerstiella sp.]